jgi:hypothetical protein
MIGWRTIRAIEKDFQMFIGNGFLTINKGHRNYQKIASNKQINKAFFVAINFSAKLKPIFSQYE